MEAATPMLRPLAPLKRAVLVVLGMGLYVLAFFLACWSWLGKGPALRSSAFIVLLAALVIHTLGLAARMYLSGRPPVTNLYSSAVFIGWGTVLIGLFLERFFKDGIGTACSGAVGFITLVIAHHLASSGDTLQMLQAVLDTLLTEEELKQTDEFSR